VRQADDVSARSRRFRTKLTLASADVQEVISAALLEKGSGGKPDEADPDLMGRRKTTPTLFRLRRQLPQLKPGWADAKPSWPLPLHPYFQLNLFQQALQKPRGPQRVRRPRNMRWGTLDALGVPRKVAQGRSWDPCRSAKLGQLRSGFYGRHPRCDPWRTKQQDDVCWRNARWRRLELRILQARVLTQVGVPV